MEPVREIVSLTKDLIRIPSTHSRAEEIHRCAAFIQSWLEEREIPCQHTVQKGAPRITALPETDRAPVLLMSHFDVVEADSEGQFHPREVNGRLYGRGAIDDKYAVALSMVLYARWMQRIRRQGGQPADIPFGLLMTGDEEVGGYNGALPALQAIDSQFVLAVDGGTPDKIITKEKGLIHLELIARGTSAHAARPWLGDNAFDRLVADYQAIRSLFEGVSEDHWHKTVVISNCQVGDGSANKVPDKATAVLDIRYTDNEDPQELIAAIKNAVRAEVNVRIVEPLLISDTSAYLDLLVANGGGASVGFEHGSSDARFSSSCGIPAAVWGADGEMSQHSATEHVVIDSLAVLYQRLDSYLAAVQAMEAGP